MDCRTAPDPAMRCRAAVPVAVDRNHLAWGATEPGAAFMQNSVWPVVQQTGESQRQTVWVQGVGVVAVGGASAGDYFALAIVNSWVLRHFCCHSAGVSVGCRRGTQVVPIRPRKRGGFN